MMASFTTVLGALFMKVETGPTTSPRLRGGGLGIRFSSLLRKTEAQQAEYGYESARLEREDWKKKSSWYRSRGASFVADLNGSSITLEVDGYLNELSATGPTPLRITLHGHTTNSTKILVESDPTESFFRWAEYRELASHGRATARPPWYDELGI